MPAEPRFDYPLFRFTIGILDETRLYYDSWLICEGHSLSDAALLLDDKVNSITNSDDKLSVLLDKLHSNRMASAALSSVPINPDSGNIERLLILLGQLNFSMTFEIEGETWHDSTIKVSINQNAISDLGKNLLLPVHVPRSEFPIVQNFYPGSIPDIYDYSSGNKSIYALIYHIITNSYPPFSNSYLITPEKNISALAAAMRVNDNLWYVELRLNTELKFEGRLILYHGKLDGCALGTGSDMALENVNLFSANARSGISTIWRLRGETSAIDKTMIEKYVQHSEILTLRIYFDNRQGDKNLFTSGLYYDADNSEFPSGSYAKFSAKNLSDSVIGLNKILQME